MNKGLTSHGYTIIEVLIVLAVTSALLVSAMILISGRQAKTEFSQAANDIQAQVSDVINNVSTGYYASRGNFSCTNNSGVPNPSIGSDELGTKKDCILLGRAIQFSVSGKPDDYRIYDVVGVRTDASGNQVDTLAKAGPIVLTGAVNTTEAKQLLYGLQVVKMQYSKNGAKLPIGSVAFLSSLGSYGCQNGLCSGSQTAGLWPIQNTSLGQDTATASSAINSAGAANFVDLAGAPDGSVTVCFQSGGTNQYAVLTMGSSNRLLSTKIDIYSIGSEPAGTCS